MLILLVPGLALLGRFDSRSTPRLGRRSVGLGVGPAGPCRLSADRAACLCCSSLLLIASVAGLLQLEIETDFTKNFRRGSPIVRSYAFIEENLGGAGVWDVLVPAPATLEPRVFGSACASSSNGCAASRFATMQAHEVVGLDEGIEPGGRH